MTCAIDMDLVVFLVYEIQDDLNVLELEDLEYFSRCFTFYSFLFFSLLTAGFAFYLFYQVFLSLYSPRLCILLRCVVITDTSV